jgi:hypothetical protein
MNRNFNLSTLEAGNSSFQVIHDTSQAKPLQPHLDTSSSHQDDASSDRDAQLRDVQVPSYREQQHYMMSQTGD